MDCKINLIYVVYKETIKRREQHPYEPLMKTIHYRGEVLIEPTLSNPAEVIQNWINRETKLYNDKRTEAEKKEFRFSIKQASNYESEEQ